MDNSRSTHLIGVQLQHLFYESLWNLTFLPVLPAQKLPPNQLREGAGPAIFLLDVGMHCLHPHPKNPSLPFAPLPFVLVLLVGYAFEALLLCPVCYFALRMHKYKIKLGCVVLRTTAPLLSLSLSLLGERAGNG